MSEDSFNVKTPIISIGLTKKEHIKEVKEGSMYLMRVWKWRRLGFTYKMLKIVNGHIVVEVMKR